jgi:hypothetical protein
MAVAMPTIELYCAPDLTGVCICGSQDCGVQRANTESKKSLAVIISAMILNRKLDLIRPNSVDCTRDKRDQRCAAVACHFHTLPPTSPKFQTLETKERSKMIGKLLHLGFDALLISAFLAGVKRTTGLTCVCPPSHRPQPRESHSGLTMSC